MKETNVTEPLQHSEVLLPQEKLKHGETVITRKEDDDTESSEYICNHLSFGDAIFAMFLVAPLVVGMWRSTWGIMELHRNMFPNVQIYLLGMLIHISFALVSCRQCEVSGN